MKMSLSKYLLILLSFNFGNLKAQNPCVSGTWFEKDGIAVIETESLPDLKGWKVETKTPNFGGSGYIIWQGNEFFNITTNGNLTYKVYINTPGKYAFEWNSSINNGTLTTEHNDAWLNISDVDNFWAEKVGTPVSLLKPRPSCTSSSGYTCPNGTSANNYFKIYSGRIESFQWRANTSDNDPHTIFFEKKTPGFISINIAARSSFFAIDRMIVYRSPEVPASTARSMLLKEKDFSCASVLSISPSSFASLKIFPNPIEDYYKVESPEGGIVEIMDSKGLLHQTDEFLPNKLSHFQVSNLQSGTYFFRIKTNTGIETKKIIKH